jgi:hypothetical protein
MSKWSTKLALRPPAPQSEPLPPLPPVEHDVAEIQKSKADRRALEKKQEEIEETLRLLQMKLDIRRHS